MNPWVVYLLGVLTVPVAVAVFLLVRHLLVVVLGGALESRGWFTETGKAPTPGVNVSGTLATRRLCGVTFGRYRTRTKWDRPGSKWVHIGPLCVGRKDPTLTLTEGEYEQLRSDFMKNQPNQEPTS